MYCKYCRKDTRGEFCSTLCRDRYYIGKTPRSRDEIIKRAASILKDVKKVVQ